MLRKEVPDDGLAKQEEVEQVGGIHENERKRRLVDLVAYSRNPNRFKRSNFSRKLQEKDIEGL